VLAIKFVRVYRQDFAKPVRHKLKERDVIQHGHSRSPPTDDVRHENIFTEMHFHSVEDPPFAANQVVVVPHLAGQNAER
jgi:hypothetical protein